MKHITTVIAASMALLAVGCAKKESGLTKSGLDPQNFVSEYNGSPTALYTLTNANGMEVCITNFGGRIVSIMAPAKAHVKSVCPIICPA